jgi:hypothetical protein
MMEGSSRRGSARLGATDRHCGRTARAALPRRARARGPHAAQPPRHDPPWTSLRRGASLLAGVAPQARPSSPASRTLQTLGSCQNRALHGQLGWQAKHEVSPPRSAGDGGRANEGRARSVGRYAVASATAAATAGFCACVCMCASSPPRDIRARCLRAATIATAAMPAARTTAPPTIAATVAASCVDHRGQRPKRGHELHGHPVGPKVHHDQRGVAHQRPATTRSSSCQLPQPTACTVPAWLQAPADQRARQGAVRLPPRDRLPQGEPGQEVAQGGRGDDHPPLQHLHQHHGDQALPGRQASRHPPLRRHHHRQPCGPELAPRRHVNQPYGGHQPGVHQPDWP